MASPKLVFTCLAALLALAHAQVVLDSSLYDPRAEQITATRVYPITVTNTETSVQLRTAYDVQQQQVETVTMLPSITEDATTIVNPTITIPQWRPRQTLTQTQTVLAARTVYVTQPQPVVRTVVNSVVQVQAPEPVAVTVTVTQIVAVRPSLRIIPTTIVRTTLITETLPVQEPQPLETVTATAYVTTTIRSVDTADVVRVTSTIWERQQGPGGPWGNGGDGQAWDSQRAPDTNVYTSTTSTDNSKFVATKTETTYFPNAGQTSAVGLRYAQGSFWTRSNLMQLFLLGAVLVASQAVLAKVFA